MNGGGTNILIVGIFHGKGTFQGVIFLGKLNAGEICQNSSKDKIRLVSCFLFGDSILRVEMLRIIIRA